MFKILDNPKATCAELADAYKQAAQAERDLKIEQDKAYETLLNIQKNHLSDTKEARQVKDARAIFETSKIKYESCLFGRGELKARMIERLPMELATRQKAIEAEQKELFAKKRDINEKYLSKIAEALVIQEQAKGRPMSDVGRGNWIERGVRSINLTMLIDEDRNYLHEQVKTFRESLPIQGEMCLDTKLSFLSDELDELSKITTEPDMADSQDQQTTIAEKLESEIERLIEAA